MDFNVSSVLSRAGYRTGTYSSPAVLEPRESFQVNRKMIARAEYARYMERVSRAAETAAQEMAAEAVPVYDNVSGGAVPEEKSQG